MNDLVIKENEQLKGLEESKAKQIKAVFDPMVDKLVEVEEAYNNVVTLDITPETCVLAKRMRLDIAKIRIEAGKIKDEQKKEILIAGNAIQGIYNIIKFAVTSKEDKLKEIERYYELIEAEKIKTKQAERETELFKYDVDGSTMDLGNMIDAVWTNFLAGTKSNYESVKVAEAKAEADRIEREKKEAEEREQMRLENERLKIEAEKAEKKRIADENKAEKQKRDRINKYSKILLESGYESRIRGVYVMGMYRITDTQLETLTEIEFQNRLEECARNHKRDLQLEKEKQDAAAEKRKADEKLKLEREAREKVEREAKEKEAERVRLEKEKADKLKEEQLKAENAPDKEKLDKLVLYMEEIGKGLIGEQGKILVREAYIMIRGYAKTLQ